MYLVSVKCVVMLFSAGKRKYHGSGVNIQCFGNTAPDTPLGLLHQYQKYLDRVDLCVRRHR